MAEQSKEVALSKEVNSLIEDPKLRDELLRAMLLNKNPSIKFDKEKVKSQIEDLTFRKESLDDDEYFTLGDIVVWKERMKNKNFPLHGQPAIVIEVLDEPVYDRTAQIGSHIFNEPHDLLLGLIMDNGDFLTFHYDKRRFKKLEE